MGVEVRGQGSPGSRVGGAQLQGLGLNLEGVGRVINTGKDPLENGSLTGLDQHRYVFMSNNRGYGTCWVLSE